MLLDVLNCFPGLHFDLEQLHEVLTRPKYSRQVVLVVLFRFEGSLALWVLAPTSRLQGTLPVSGNFGWYYPGGMLIFPAVPRSNASVEYLV